MPIRKDKSIILITLSISVLFVACGGDEFPVAPDLTTIPGYSPYQQPVDTETDQDSETDTLAVLMGIGDPCEASEDCFITHNVVNFCQTPDSQQCIPQPVCSSVDNTCQTLGSDGTFPQDSPCMTNTNCEVGLVCSNVASCQPIGSPGTTLLGENCLETSDCVFGLACDNGVCAGYQFVFWDGAQCAEPPEEEPPTFEPLFDAARETGEYYALPFPNDAAMKNGKIDLTGHANPGVLIEELGNPIDTYFEYIENELDGFGLNMHIYFRFNKAPNWDTVDNMENIYILNITENSPRYREKEWTGYTGSSAKGMYICNNWMALKPSFGLPLKPSTTYAAIITNTLEDRDGNSLERNLIFNAMLQSSAPSDDNIKDAWDAYAPLREYVANNPAFEIDNVAVASVFTTQSAPNALPRVREQVRSEDPPALVGNISSNTDGANFTTYTGTVTVPFYQEGERPFKEEGGQVEYNGSGFPILVEDDEVPFALSVPDGTAPAEGWPIFMYAHGTGGTEESFTTGENSVAEILADKGIAVISLLQVQHGERRKLTGDQIDNADYGEDVLFYNFANPYAAVGNNVQAAADYFQLVRFIEDFANITSEPIAFDPAKIYFFGHSQGTQGQFIAAAHEPLVKGIVLSGAGGYLVESLLGKKEPVDIATGIQVLLMDPNVDSKHPVLNLIQAAMEQIDPINHASAVYRNEWPNQTYPYRDVFMSYGIGDSFAPENTQAALAKALHLDVDTIVGHEIPGTYTEINSFPHIDAHTYGGEPLNTVAVQYEPDGSYDGHFVIFNHERALAQWPHFVEGMVAEDGNSPELIEGQ